jgi:hypothetical protein
LKAKGIKSNTRGDGSRALRSCDEIIPMADFEGRQIRYYVVTLRGVVSVWTGTDKQLTELMRDEPALELDLRPFDTKKDAEERRLALTAR